MWRLDSRERGEGCACGPIHPSHTAVAESSTLDAMERACAMDMVGALRRTLLHLPARGTRFVLIKRAHEAAGYTLPLYGTRYPIALLSGYCTVGGAYGGRTGLRTFTQRGSPIAQASPSVGTRAAARLALRLRVIHPRTSFAARPRPSVPVNARRNARRT